MNHKNEFMNLPNDAFPAYASPGKLILSGEHAVVHGLPGLTLAIDLLTHVDIKKTAGEGITFEYLNNKKKYHYNWAQLIDITYKIKKQYQQFLTGNADITGVIKKPVELLVFTATQFIEKCQAKLKSAISIKVNSTIPIGSGLGSSAAVITSLLKQLAVFCQQPLPPEILTQLALNAESLQHGKTSGIDIYTVLHGGCLFFQNQQIHPRKMPNFPIYLVNTGTPQSSTGECVAHAARYFQQNNIKNAFEQTTILLDDAIKSYHYDNTLKAVRQNHDLLTQIGVVPDKVQQFIMACEQKGAAAKISGAGSISGDAAGHILLIAPFNPTNLATAFNYSIRPVKGVTYAKAV